MRLRRLLLGISLTLACIPAFPATYTVNAGQSTAAIQGVINGASAGDAVSFAAGTYSITAQLTLKCGVTYTGPLATPATAILNGSGSGVSSGNGLFTLYANPNLSNPCTQATTIQYFNFQAVTTGIYVQTSFTNLTIQHNQFTSIPGHTSQTAGIVFQSGTTTSNTASILTNTTVTWNQFGDSNSCVSPTNVMMDTDSPEDYEGACNGMVFFTSINGLTVTNNLFYHVAEGVHINCPNYANQQFPCEPPGGAITYNITAEFNDFSNIHRITWEQQPQQASGLVWEYNSEHDWYVPYFGAFGLSMACCYNGTTPPNMIASNNVVIFNVNAGSRGRYGYGMEAMGKNATYDHELIQAANSPSSAPGMAWGCGNVTSMSNNTVQGGFGGAYIVSEGSFPCGTVTQPILNGNVTGPTVTPITSVAPSISPSPGGYASPLTVTLTDPGYTSGPQPLGNTSIYYTTDGSTPNPSGASTAAQYYLSPSGSDSNPGTLASPWLSPNHAVNCGDTITAIAGAYSSANFNTGKWGTVTCAAANNVAWLKCATFDACKINSTTGTAPGLWIDKSYWGVQGFEVSVGSGVTFGTCFEAGVPSAGTVIHHIVFANNIANGCQNGGFVTFNTGTTGGVDYVAFIGNIAYNAAQGSHSCTSGFSVYQPIASDTNPGTHFYIAGNFAWNNVNPATCNGTPPTDGEAVILDTFDFSQGGGTPYTQQAVVENNIGFYNGGRGFESFQNQAGSSHATIYVDHNTAYGDMTDNNQTNGCLGRAELAIGYTRNTNYDHNLAQTRTGSSCSGGPLYGLTVETGDSSDSVTNNWYDSTAGNNAFIDNSGTFSLGSGNVAGTNPGFANPVNPGAPSCGSFASVPACMATVISDYTPTASGATAYGYQRPSLTPVTNALFPQWLCNVGLPPGLASTPCTGGNTTKLYTVPIIVSLPVTISAVGMWGSGANPLSYPSGYGFVPSAVQTATYTSSGGVTLSSVSIAPAAGVSTLLVGGTVQMIVTCHYSDGSTSGCNTTDSHGNAVTSWMSSNGNVTVSSSGLATGQAIGTANISASVTGGFTTSPPATLTVSANPLTLSSVSIATAGGVSSINTGTTNQLIATCHYNDGSTTPCNTMDGHGNAASSYSSSAPTIATVTPGGLVTGMTAGSTNLTGSVTPAPSMLGTNLQNISGYTNNGFINEIYGVTGTSAGNYTPGNCHIILPATTWVAGKLWTCLLVLGTPTTQNASALCSNSYTTTGTSWPGGDLIIPMASCPALPPDQSYWVGSTTNQTTANPVQGFSNCNGSCNGAAPIFGSGTYAYRYVANTFGNYTSLPTTLTASGGTQQVSQYIELTTTPVTSANLPLSITMPPPSLVSAYLTASSASMTVGDTMQMAAKCHYTSGPDQDCTVADIYGDAVSAWVSSDPTKATVSNVGASNPGLVTAIAAGTPSITATIGTGTTTSAYPITINNPPVTLTGVSLSLTGGVTGLFVGATNQLKATCTYSDGSNDDCTATDAHGNLAHNYVSTVPAHATVNATSGLVTGVTPGATTFTAVAGSFTSNALPLNVFPVLSGIYTITVSGPVKFSGTVRF